MSGLELENVLEDSKNILSPLTTLKGGDKKLKPILERVNLG